MINRTVLIVEDDTAIRNLIKNTLEIENYPYHIAENGAQALMEATTQKPDIILLDLGLPDMDGVEIIRKIRTWSSLPIIVISARSEDKDKIDALDAGADDYMTKPFSTSELLARIRSTSRRLQYLDSAMHQETPVFQNGKLEIDYALQCAAIGKRSLHLTPTEYKILCLLAQNVGRVLTHSSITKEIWGSAFESDIASLRVHVATLRKKMEKESEEIYIQTHIGIGYCMLKIEESES
jgi:two-component system KDP operon response regulator KdpE